MVGDISYALQSPTNPDERLNYREQADVGLLSPAYDYDRASSLAPLLHGSTKFLVSGDDNEPADPQAAVSNRVANLSGPFALPDFSTDSSNGRTLLSDQ